jgi:hypothetical protein
MRKTAAEPGWIRASQSHPTRRSVDIEFPPSDRRTAFRRRVSSRVSLGTPPRTPAQSARREPPPLARVAPGRGGAKAPLPRRRMSTLHRGVWRTRVGGVAGRGRQWPKHLASGEGLD